MPLLVQLSKMLPGDKESRQIVVGYRDELFLTEDLEKNGTLYLASEDGQHGTKGNVLDCIRENGLQADVIYACGWFADAPRTEGVCRRKPD